MQTRSKSLNKSLTKSLTKSLDKSLDKSLNKSLDKSPVVETCAICYEALISTEPIKIVHEDSQNNWKHRFHEKCIDEWSFACIAKDKAPSCPLCPSIQIPKRCFPLNNFRNTALEYFEGVKNAYKITPFFGFMICLEGECVMKLTDIDICEKPISYNTTLNDIKRIVSQKGLEIYMKSGGIFSSTNSEHNRTLSNWTNWKYPSIEVVHTCYTIPPSRISCGDLDIKHNDDLSLREMYIEYFTKLEKMKSNKDTHPETLKQIHDISTKKNLKWNEGYYGYDAMTDYPHFEEGYYDRGYFNPENPEIPPKYCAFKYSNKVTHNPIAWMAIYVKYV